MLGIYAVVKLVAPKDPSPVKIKGETICVETSILLEKGGFYDSKTDFCICGK